MKHLTLVELAEKYPTDKLEHGYLPHYEHHLPRSTEGTFFEIGVASGGSLKMWKEYFLKADVIGVDIAENAVGAVIGDATDKNFIISLELQSLRVVIDDGSHRASDIIKSFELLWPLLETDGWYVVEDLGAQFCSPFEGNEAGSQATRFLYNKLIDVFRNDIAEFHAYPEIVFLRKR